MVEKFLFFLQNIGIGSSVILRTNFVESLKNRRKKELLTAFIKNAMRFMI